MAADPAVPSLADVLAEHMPDRSGDYLVGNVGCECGAEGYVESDDGPIALDDAKTRWWAEHVESAFWAARTVHTAEQLDALPNESMYMATHEIALAEQKCGEVWKSVGNTDPFEPGLPGRVLWLPGEGEQ